MAFAVLVKNRQLAFITKILAIFGVVEERQMRELFSYMSDDDYGKIQTRLYREGLVYRAPDAKYMATSRYSIERFNIERSVMCFWAFIRIKEKVLDFCAGEDPTMVAVSTRGGDYDLIPVDGKNTDAINAHCDDYPDETVRLFVTKDLKNLEGIVRRLRNDLVLLVGPNGVTDAYEL